MGAGRDHDADGAPAGDLSTIMEYYQSLRPRRMVILGAPGSGKTVLLLELHRRAGVPVPVRLSLAAWSTEAPFEEWLAV